MDYNRKVSQKLKLSRETYSQSGKSSSVVHSGHVLNDSF